MSRAKRTRVRFSLKERIRDHHLCKNYFQMRIEDVEYVNENWDIVKKEELVFEGCLVAAGSRNAPRVCHENCPCYVKQDPKEALRIAEIMDEWIAEHKPIIDDSEEDLDLEE